MSWLFDAAKAINGRTGRLTTGSAGREGGFAGAGLRSGWKGRQQAVERCESSFGPLSSWVGLLMRALVARGSLDVGPREALGRLDGRGRPEMGGQSHAVKMAMRQP